MPLEAPSGSPEERPHLPAPLAEQVGLMRRHLELNRAFEGSVLLRYLDAALLNICEIAEVDLDLLNRVLALRTASERLAQAVDASGRAVLNERSEARERALSELAALEEVLAHATPSAATQALRRGW